MVRMPRKLCQVNGRFLIEQTDLPGKLRRCTASHLHQQLGSRSRCSKVLVGHHENQWGGVLFCVLPKMQKKKLASGNHDYWSSGDPWGVNHVCLKGWQQWQRAMARQVSFTRPKIEPSSQETRQRIFSLQLSDLLHCFWEVRGFVL